MLIGGSLTCHFSTAVLRVETKKKQYCRETPLFVSVTVMKSSMFDIVILWSKVWEKRGGKCYKNPATMAALLHTIMTPDF